MRRPIKVLALVDSLTLGGAENLLATLASAGTEAGLNLRVASLAGPVGPATNMATVLESAALR